MIDERYMDDFRCVSARQFVERLLGLPRPRFATPCVSPKILPRQRLVLEVLHYTQSLEEVLFFRPCSHSTAFSRSTVHWSMPPPTVVSGSHTLLDHASSQGHTESHGLLTYAFALSCFRGEVGWTMPSLKHCRIWGSMGLASARLHISRPGWLDLAPVTETFGARIVGASSRSHALVNLLGPGFAEPTRFDDHGLL